MFRGKKLEYLPNYKNYIIIHAILMACPLYMCYTVLYLRLEITVFTIYS